MTQRNSPSKQNGVGWLGRVIPVLVVVLVILGIGAATMRFAQVDEGQRGIIITQGAVEGVQEPGIFFRLFAPFTRLELVNVKRQTRQISQNVASSDKQLYDIDIQVDYSRRTDEESLRQQYGRIGVSDEQLNAFLDGFINDALKTASTQFTLDQALSDRGSFSQRITQFLRQPPADGQQAPIDQLFINLEAVKVLDIKVGDAYAQLLAEKANLEVQIETEEKRRQQIEAEQANDLFQAEQEAKVALTKEKGLTASQMEAANREAQIREVQGQAYRNNPELLELRRLELQAEMLKAGNIWFIDPSTNLSLLLNTQGGNTTVLPQSTPAPTSTPEQFAPVTPEPTPQP